MREEHFPLIMNVHEVADYLRVAPATTYRLAQAGKIPCGKVGRAWRFRKQAIESWISEQPGSPTDPGWPIGEMIEGFVIDMEEIEFQQVGSHEQKGQAGSLIREYLEWLNERI
jgi:excisionase family DNA binding protein